MTNVRYMLICATLLAGTLCTADEGGRKIAHRVEPEESPLAQKMQLHGTVKLKLYIDPDGSVHRVEYISGHPLLSQPAIEATKQWKYELSDKESTDEVSFKY
jgi:TonB family protein